MRLVTEWPVAFSRINISPLDKGLEPVIPSGRLDLFVSARGAKVKRPRG